MPLKYPYPAAANAHDCFLRYEVNISLSSRQKLQLKQSRKAIERKIIQYFKAHPSIETPKFWIQGSAKMGTMVLDKNGTYDVDLGVYFLSKPTSEAITLQRWVLRAVTGQTAGGAQHRDKCIRVIYQNAFDIDLPVYYKTPHDKHPFLATKSGWVVSDPKELCDWFKKRSDSTGQLKRIVKYFKGWAAARGRKMPSGVAFTVWAASYFQPDKRDDVAFYETAKAIKKELIWGLKCKNPAVPGDDFLSRLDSFQKEAFKKALSALIEAGRLALKQKTIAQAAKIWRGQLGNRFPAPLICTHFKIVLE